MRHRHILVLLAVPLLSVNTHGQPGWNLQTSPVSDQLAEVHFANLNQGWIATESGEVLHTTNGGTDWSIQDPEPTDSIFFLGHPAVPLSFINATTGWVIGTRGDFGNPGGAVLYKTTNGGAQWIRQNLTPWNYGIAIQFIDANNGWATVAADTFPDIAGAVIRTTDGGVSWSPGGSFGNSRAVIPFFLDLNNAWLLIDSIVAAGQEANLVCPCELYHTTNAGTTWTIQLRDLSPGAYQVMHVVDASNAWVVGDSAKVLKTTNGGNAWAPISVPGMQSNSENRAVFLVGAALAWIGGRGTADNNVVFHTTDGGSSWATQTTPFNNTVSDLFFVDANNGWAVSGGGGIAHTTNGGVTGVGQDHRLPGAYRLEQNYPNPFNPTTTIGFALPRTSYITLKIYNLLGQEIATLVEGERVAGTYTEEWKPENLPSGMYVYRLQSDKLVETRKLVLLK